jgi:hypothetical protein
VSFFFLPPFRNKKAQTKPWSTPSGCGNNCGGCGDECNCAVLADAESSLLFGENVIACDQHVYSGWTYPYPSPEDWPPNEPPAVRASTTVNITSLGSWRYYLSRTGDAGEPPLGIMHTGLRVNGVPLGGVGFGSIHSESADSCWAWDSKCIVPDLSVLGKPGNDCGKTILEACPANAGLVASCLDISALLQPGTNTFDLLDTGYVMTCESHQTIYGCTSDCTGFRVKMFGNTDIYLWRVPAASVPNTGGEPPNSDKSKICCCVACCEPDGSCSRGDAGGCVARGGHPQSTDTCSGVDCGHPCCIGTGAGGFCIMMTESDCDQNNGIWHSDKTSCCDDGLECGTCGCNINAAHIDFNANIEACQNGQCQNSTSEFGGSWINEVVYDGDTRPAPVDCTVGPYHLLSVLLKQWGMQGCPNDPPPIEDLYEYFLTIAVVACVTYWLITCEDYVKSAGHGAGPCKGLPGTIWPYNEAPFDCPVDAGYECPETGSNLYAPPLLNVTSPLCG